MPVCVGGMHRSGTSMVAKLLHLCGLYLGNEGDLMPASSQNPDGFWENVKFTELNDDLLNELGGGWDFPPAVPAEWNGPAFAPLRAKAEVLLEEFRDREPWGWKDPRNSLVLPFWVDLLGPPKVIVVVRNPLEVALSLRMRNSFSYALGLHLWTIHNRRILEAAPTERLVTHYDAYFHNPAAELKRVLAFIGIAATEETIDQAITASVSDLRHYRYSAQHLLDADVASDVLDLYLQLSAEADWLDDGGAHRVPSMAAAGIIGGGGVLSQNGRGRAQRTEGLQQGPAGDEGTGPRTPTPLVGVGRLIRSVVEIEVLRRELEAWQRGVAERDQGIAELRRELEAWQRGVAERDQGIAELRRGLEAWEAGAAERDAAIAQLRAALQEHETARLAAEERAEQEAAERAASQERAELAAAQLEAAAREIAAVRAVETELRQTVATLQQALTGHREAAAEHGRTDAEHRRVIAEHERTIAEQARRLAAQEQTLAEQTEHLDALAARLESIPNREAELRRLLLDANDQLVRRDAEILSTLGALRQRDPADRAAVVHAPALVQRIREIAIRALPKDAHVLVVSSGDEALLLLEGRRAWHFPRADNGGYANFSPVDGMTLVDHLRALREKGATHLLVPSTAVGWLMGFAEFKQHVEQHYRFVVRDFGTCLIFAANAPTAPGDR